GVPGGLWGGGVGNLGGGGRAVAELGRAGGELGFGGVIAAPEPVNGRRLDHPGLFPFYLTAERLGAPILLHQATGIRLPTAGADRFDNYCLTPSASHPFEQMLACATGPAAALPD